MSLIFTRAVWELSETNGTSRLVLLCLADHANDRGMSWPSVGTIARECRLSERGVQKNLKKLKEAGDIRVARLGGGKSRTTRYMLTVTDGSLSRHQNPERQGPNPEPAFTRTFNQNGDNNPLAGLTCSERYKAMEIRNNIP